MTFRIQWKDVSETGGKFFPKYAEYLRSSDSLRAETGTSGFHGYVTLIQCIQLAIRALRVLIYGEASTEEDVARLKRLVDSVPYTVDRVKLWAEIALQFYLAGRDRDCRQIVTNYIDPIIEAFSRDSRHRHAIVQFALPAIWAAHHSRGLELAKTLPGPLKDGALGLIAELILRHRSPFDAFEGEGQFRTVLSREEIIDVCEVLKVMYSDSSPFGYFQRMVAAIHEHRQSYTGQQLNDMVLKLKELRDLFPNPRFIQHEGYLVLFDTAIGQLERKLDNQTWNELKARADKIPNLADRALVLAWMSEEVVPGFVDFPDADSLGFSHRFGFGILSVQETGRRYLII